MYSQTTQFDTRTRELIEEMLDLQAQLERLDRADRQPASTAPAHAPALCGS
jgi:hypothetical protein